MVKYCECGCYKFHVWFTEKEINIRCHSCGLVTQGKGDIVYKELPKEKIYSIDDL